MRQILHLLVDGFPVAVERLRDPELKGRPVVICARHSPRSLVFSASREARGEGVHEGLPLTKALRRCRRLVVLPANGRLYQKAAGEIARLLEIYSPLVESSYLGRFYVDMTGSKRLFGHVQDSAFQIRCSVQDSVGLRSTLGIGSNKLVSGVAARVVESHGDLYAVPSGSEASFLAPLGVDVLPAVRQGMTRTLLAEFNIRVVQQLAAFSVVQLTSVFGKRGILLRRQALGIDERPVQPLLTKPFVLEEMTLDEDTNDDAILLGIIYGMLERACRRMRAKGVLPSTVWLHIRYTDGVDVARRLVLRTPVAVDPLLFQRLEGLFLKASNRRQRVRYLSLTFTDFIFPSCQLTLFRMPGHHRKEEALVVALDRIRAKHGERAVQFGRTLGFS